MAEAQDEKQHGGTRRVPTDREPFDQIEPAVIDDSGALQMSQDRHNELVRSLHIQFWANGLTEQDAEDCLHNAIIALLAKSQWLDPGPVGGWLMRAAKFEAKHLIRDQARARAHVAATALEAIPPTVMRPRHESPLDNLAARIALGEMKKAGRPLTRTELVSLGVVDENRSRLKPPKESALKRGRDRLRRLARYRGLKLVTPACGGWQILDTDTGEAAADPAALTDDYSVEQWLLAQPTTGENIGEQTRLRRKIADASGLSLERVRKMSQGDRDQMARSLEAVTA